MIKRIWNVKIHIMLLTLLTIFFLTTDTVISAPFPAASLKFAIEDAKNPEEVAVTLKIVALLTILSLAPSILIMMTSFTRLVIVFHFLKQAMGTQQSPPNQVIIGLSLFITFFIMQPVWNEIYKNALEPYLDKTISYKKAFENAKIPMRKFMLINTREKDISLFVKASKVNRPKTKNDVPFLVLIPAFIISELQTAFIIGFVLYVPFLILDMVVSSVLLSMGMMMLPPIMVSLPFKIMLFVLIDGWNLIVGSLIKSFGMI